MIVVQAAPNTHPGGVQGALSRPRYQSPMTALEVNILPIANAPKLRNKKTINRTNITSKQKCWGFVHGYKYLFDLILRN